MLKLEAFNDSAQIRKVNITKNYDYQLILEILTQNKHEKNLYHTNNTNQTVSVRIIQYIRLLTQK